MVGSGCFNQIRLHTSGGTNKTSDKGVKGWPKASGVILKDSL